jgi:hypothetical protein
MTALKKYQKLESPGLWRETPEAQRRDVVVALGDVSLTLSDPRSDAALTHWSLPAILRRNPGEFPALYQPGEDAVESLELDDADMITAIETIRAAVIHARPRPGRLRGVITLALLASVAAAAVFWLPGALVGHAASVLPTATRAGIGQAALADLARVTGQPCTGAQGVAALNRLAARLAPGAPPRLVVVPEGPARSLHLPGRVIVLHRSLIEDHDSAEVLGGYALAELAASTARDPMLALLDHAGLRATLGLLTTGALADEAVSGYSEVLLSQPQVPVADADLLALFAAARLPAAPYAYARDASGETTLGLIEASLPADGADPLLPDADWLGLRSICPQ